MRWPEPAGRCGSVPRRPQTCSSRPLHLLPGASAPTPTPGLPARPSGGAGAVGSDPLAAAAPGLRAGGQRPVRAVVRGPPAGNLVPSLGEAAARLGERAGVRAQSVRLGGRVVLRELHSPSTPSFLQWARGPREVRSNPRSFTRGLVWGKRSLQSDKVESLEMR